MITTPQPQPETRTTESLHALRERETKREGGSTAGGRKERGKRGGKEQLNEVERWEGREHEGGAYVGVRSVCDFKTTAETFLKSLTNSESNGHLKL